MGTCARSQGLLFVLTFLFKLPLAASAGWNDVTEEAIRAAMFEGYNKDLAPGLSLDRQPTGVAVQLFFASMSAIDQRKMSYSCDVYFRQRWNDPRLAYQNLTLPHLSESEETAGDYFPSTINLLPYADKLWTTDVYFPDAVGLQETDGLLKVAPNGDILWSRRLIATFKCIFDFSQIPYDTQNCKINMETYSQTIDTTTLRFTEPGAEGFTSIVNNQWGAFSASYHSGVSEYSTGDYPYATVEWQMTRQPYFYLLDGVIPSVVFVVMSYCGFWINPAAAPGRIALSVICVLITVTSLQKIAASMPTISYPVWLTSYLAGCLGFNLVAVFCYTLVNYGMQCKAAEAAAKEKAQEAVKSALAGMGGPASSVLPSSSAPRDPHDGEDGGDPDESADGAADERAPSPQAAPGPPPEGPAAGDCLFSLPPLSDLTKLDHLMRYFFPIAFSIYTAWMFSRIDSYEQPDLGTTNQLQDMNLHPDQDSALIVLIVQLCIVGLVLFTWFVVRSKVAHHMFGRELGAPLADSSLPPQTPVEWQPPQPRKSASMYSPSAQSKSPPMYSNASFEQRMFSQLESAQLQRPAPKDADATFLSMPGSSDSEPETNDKPQQG